MATERVVVEKADLCVLGAGIAGLNALAVASEYLGKDQRVIVVDRRPRAGGMWLDTYDYVRLHQPHRLFTAGNLRWNLRAKRSHLASKGEVIDHFGDLFERLSRRMKLDAYFGWEYESHQEADDVVRVTCKSADGQTLVIETPRLIKAFGFAVERNDPLALTSTSVRSVSPNFCDMRGAEMSASDAPVWVVGSGKTAMDTAHTLITENPGRAVSLVAGAGTMFQCRDLYYPTGWSRWAVGGRTPNSIYTEVARMFDGTNEDDVFRWMRENICVDVTPGVGRMMFGIMSRAEAATIRDGLASTVMDYLDDAVDTPDGVELRFRSGDTQVIPDGSWIVNCTGYALFRMSLPEPFVSRTGRVISVNERSSVLVLTTQASYFLTHLMFRNKLTELPLYELDTADLRRSSPMAMPIVVFAHNLYNLAVAFKALPLSVFLKWGTDVDRWYPPHRRMATQLDFIRNGGRDIKHVRKSLDTVRERFGVRCGPLDFEAAPPPAEQRPLAGPNPQ